MAATKCIEACNCSQEVQLLFRTNIRMGKNLMENQNRKSYFYRGMINDGRPGGLNIIALIYCSATIRRHICHYLVQLLNDQRTRNQSVVGYILPLGPMLYCFRVLLYCSLAELPNLCRFSVVTVSLALKCWRADGTDS